jgi:hypothetical protein
MKLLRNHEGQKVGFVLSAKQVTHSFLVQLSEDTLINSEVLSPLSKIPEPLD